MRVTDYQRIYEINQTTLDNVERVALMICHIFNLSAEKVDSLSSIKFLKLADKVQKKLVIKKPFFNKFKLQTDASKITLGQFIECQHWMKNDVAQSVHLIAASTLIYPKPFNHQTDAQNFLRVQIGCIYEQVITFIKSFEDLIACYSGLFPKSEEGEEEEKPHQFILQFGWIFSAKQVAEHEGITLDQAFSLPIIQALNVLAYLKSKQSFDKWQSKQ